MTRNFALKTSLIYAAGGLIYKVVSDRFLSGIVDHDTFVVLQSFKGFAFIVITAGLFYLLLQRGESKSATAREEGRMRTPALVLLGATALTLAIIGSGWLVFQNMVASMEQKALDEVHAVAELKAGDLGRWLRAQESAVASLAATWPMSLKTCCIPSVRPTMPSS